MASEVQVIACLLLPSGSRNPGYMRGAPRSYVIRVTFLRILGPVHDVVTKGPRGLSEHNIVTRTVIGLPPQFDVGCGEEDNHPGLFAGEESLNVRL